MVDTLVAEGISDGAGGVTPMVISYTTVVNTGIAASFALPVSINATQTILIAPALGSYSLQQIAMAFTGAVAASDTNYWTVDIVRYAAAVATTLITKNTKVTGGAAIAANTDWNYDALSFTTAVCNKGDVLAITFTKTGTPVALVGGVICYRFQLGTNSGGDIIFTDNLDGTYTVSGSAVDDSVAGQLTLNSSAVDSTVGGQLTITT